MKKKPEPKHMEIKGQTIEYFELDRDLNGNPRIVFHFTDLGLTLTDYEMVVKGLSKYRGKWFGGGYVMQAHDIKHSLNRAVELADEHTMKRFNKALNNPEYKNKYQ